MSGRLLSFSQYLGGADNVQVIEMFPDDQQNFTYDFNTDISVWKFTSDYQSILLDTVAFDRQTSLPNFADTTVSGYFDNYSTVDANVNINTLDAVNGVVQLTIPANRYTGNVLPNARQNVVATVLAFEWETDETPPQKQRHRWCILERFDPRSGNPPGDPADETDFVSLISE